MSSQDDVMIEAMHHLLVISQLVSNTSCEHHKTGFVQVRLTYSTSAG